MLRALGTVVKQPRWRTGESQTGSRLFASSVNSSNSTDSTLFDSLANPLTREDHQDKPSAFEQALSSSLNESVPLDESTPQSSPTLVRPPLSLLLEFWLISFRFSSKIQLYLQTIYRELRPLHNVIPQTRTIQEGRRDWQRSKRGMIVSGH